MFRLVAALLAAAVFAAIFAAIYYDSDNVELREGAGAFNLAPGEVRQDSLQPSIRGSPIYVEVTVNSGMLDIYVMDKEWSSPLAKGGELRLDEPFNYHAKHSKIGVTGTHNFTLISDGLTWTTIVFDYSDNFYDDDTAPDENVTAGIKVVTRFIAEEQQSLRLGYIATIPSVLLVVVTLGRQANRWRKQRQKD